MNETARTILLGVAGLCVAIVLSVAALQLTNQQVGITAEPVDAGSDLAPSRTRTHRLEPVLDEAQRAEREARSDESDTGREPSTETDTDEGGGQADGGGQNDERNGDHSDEDNNGDGDHGGEDDKGGEDDD